jgi:SPX domain protein involved in polyphosphate accumulation
MDYKALKDLIKEAADELASAGAGTSFSPRTTSLTVARAGGRRTADERFYELLEAEVAKVNKLTVGRVSELKKRLKALRAAAAAARDGAAAAPSDLEAAPQGALLDEAKAVGDEFLALEKYVNLNYLGFHKILKKHDKNVPHAPCQQFYVAHLHHQPWVQGNYSGLLVQLSAVYSALRGDAAGTRNEDAAQGFVRSTTKYWVRTADVSAVKHHILQHLPVFQFSAGDGVDDGAGDAQLINSA